MDIKNGANSLLKLLKKDKFRNVILFLGIGGIALIYISTWIDFSPKEPEAEQETVSYSAAEYERQLETGLRQVVAAITAAIAAVWQAPTGFVVRHVKRVSNAPAWNRAGREEQTYSRF